MQITDQLIMDTNEAFERGDREFISEGITYRIISESNIDIEIEVAYADK